jgi:hypothetical protein
MKIALFANDVVLAQHLTREALARNHSVLVVLLQQSNFTLRGTRLNVVSIDEFTPDVVEWTARNQATLVCAIESDPGLIVAAARSFTAAPRANINRLLVLQMSQGSVIEEEGIPGEIEQNQSAVESYFIAEAHADALEIYSESDLDWSCLTTVAPLVSGSGSGCYQTGERNC